MPGDARAFAGIGMMGGPMSANDRLAVERAVARAAARRRSPPTSRSSAIASAGSCSPRRSARACRATPTPEIGWGEVDGDRSTPRRDWFGGRDRFTTFQWHYDIFELPPGATRVLTNAFNPQQAYALGKHIGFQCHIEMTREMVETWCRSGAGELPARSSGAKQSRDDIFAISTRGSTALSRVADDVYARWATGLAR